MVVGDGGGAMMSSFERSQEREGVPKSDKGEQGKGEYKSWSFGHFAKT